MRDDDKGAIAADGHIEAATDLAAWERPELRRLDAADAEAAVGFAGTDAGIYS